jgi:hypothetical protein
LLKDAERRRSYGSAARTHVAEHFGVDKMVEGTLSCYRRFSSQSANSA